MNMKYLEVALGDASIAGRLYFVRTCKLFCVLFLTLLISSFLYYFSLQKANLSFLNFTGVMQEKHQDITKHNIYTIEHLR